MTTNSCGDLDWRFIHIKTTTAFQDLYMGPSASITEHLETTLSVLIKVRELLFRSNKPHFFW